MYVARDKDGDLYLYKSHKVLGKLATIQNVE